MATAKSNAGFLSSSCHMIYTSFDLDEVLNLPEHSGHDHDQIADSNSQLDVADLPSLVLQSEDIDDIVCAVCMEGFDAGAVGKRVPCGHVYHEECISPWLSRCNSCPLCRHNISTPSPS